MKVLMVNSLYYPDDVGGAETTLRIIAEGLVRHGVSVVVACLSPGPNWDRSRVGDVPVIRIPVANVYWPFGRGPAPLPRRIAWHLADSWNPVMAGRLDRVVQSEKPDLVNLNNLSGFSAAVIPRILSRSIPVVSTMHDFYFLCVNTAMFRHGSNCARQCAQCRVLTAARRRWSRRVTSVVGVSGAMLDQLRQGGSFAGVPASVVLNGLPRCPGPTHARRDRAPGEPLRLGFLGRLAETKGIETLIAAVRELRDLPVTALIAGRGTASYTATLKSSAAGLPIEFLGHVEPSRLFSEIDLLVAPSIWREPMGRVLLEAMHHGIPVAAAASGGMPEIVRSTGGGVLFRPGDAAQLAAIVRGFVEHGFPAREWQKACLRASDLFDTDRQVIRLIQIFHQALARPSPGRVR